MDWLARISPQVHLVWHGLWRPGMVEMERKLYDHELVVLTRGKCTVTVGHEPFGCSTGSFIIIPPGRTHMTVGSPDEEVYRYCIHFDWIWQGPATNRPVYAFLPGPFNPAAVHKSPSFVPNRILFGSMGDQSKVLSLMETLVFNWKLHQGRDMICRAWLLEILLMLLGERPLEKTGRERERHLALKVKDILDQSVFKNETIRARLEQLEYSYEHLSRVFFGYFSMTMVGYLNRVRLENAKRMLESRKLRISEVAYKLGYNTPRYFSRLFRRQTGMTPQQFVDQ